MPLIMSSIPTLSRNCPLNHLEMDDLSRPPANCERTTEVIMLPCAACRLLRRRCSEECNFAPYFPRDDPQKFACVHRIFGSSNINKLLQDIPIYQRSDAVSSMVYEAHARIRDPVYGCVGAVCRLQKQIVELQSQLALAQAEIASLRINMQQHTYDDFFTDITAQPHTMQYPPPNAYYDQQLSSSMFLDAQTAFNSID